MLCHQASLLLWHWRNHTDTRSLNSYLLGRESWSTVPTASLAHRAVWLANRSCATGISTPVMCLELEGSPCLGVPGQKVLLLPCGGGHWVLEMQDRDFIFLSKQLYEHALLCEQPVLAFSLLTQADGSSARMLLRQQLCSG